jgi:hypothetical protein
VDENRRLLLGASAAATAALLLSGQANASGRPVAEPRTSGDTPPDTELDVPTLPATPTPGKPGDFDFLHGEWRIRHWRKPSANAAWDDFEGEATCWSILGGIGSVEELRIPARQFSGMGLRLLDVKRQRWSDHWVNANSGVVTAPGLEGSFENGIGLFVSREEEDGKPLLAAGIWDQISRDGCRWRQALSRDDGRTWEHNWVMHWRRA